MSKTFRYTKMTGHYYCMASDEWEEDGVDFDYQVDDDDLLDEVVELLFDEYFKDEKEIIENKDFCKLLKNKLREAIDEKDMLSILVEQYEETLKDIFQDQALEWYNN